MYGPRASNFGSVVQKYSQATTVIGEARERPQEHHSLGSFRTSALHVSFVFHVLISFAFAEHS